MRKVFALALLLSSLSCVAQDFSTINFIGRGRIADAEIYLNRRKVGELNRNENFQYKIHSEGQLDIVIKQDEFTAEANIEVKQGKVYYFKVNWISCKLISEEEGAPAFADSKKTSYGEEDIKNPVIKKIPVPQASDDAYGLPHSIIYLYRIPTNALYDRAAYSVSFPNQQAFGLPAATLIQYKVYSEGDVSIEIQSFAGLSYYTLNLKRGNNYYLLFKKDEVKEVNKDNETFRDILMNPKNVVKRDENFDFPINKSSLKDIAKKEGKGQGTCFLISSDGYLVTNFHCIENAKEIIVMGIDGDFTTKYAAKLVASDPSNDLALLKLSNKNLKFEAIPFGIRPAGVAQGEKVYALGFPAAEIMGQEIKITEGIISSKSGTQGDISKFQISAPVNPGNSGGPLIDEEGNIIGVVYAKSTIAEAAGYAVKASYLETFLKNVDDFQYPEFVNSVKDKTLVEKIKDLKGYIFIIETN